MPQKFPTPSHPGSADENVDNNILSHDGSGRPLKRRYSHKSVTFEVNENHVNPGYEPIPEPKMETNELGYDPAMVAAIYESFDVLAEPVINDPSYNNENIPHVTILKADTSIIVGDQTKKIPSDICKLPDGTLVVVNKQNFDHGRYSVLRQWTDMQTGEKFAAKILHDYSPKLKEDKPSDAQKLEIEAKAVFEAKMFNLYYNTYLGGIYKDKTRVLKLHDADGEKLIILMPFFKKKQSDKKQKMLIDDEKKQNDLAASDLRLNTSTMKNMRSDSNMTMVDNEEEEYSDPSKVALFFDSFVRDELGKQPEFKRQQVEAAKATRKNLIKKGVMDFAGDKIPKTVEEYKKEYSGKSVSELQVELLENTHEFIPDNFNDDWKMPIMPENKKIITKKMDIDFLEKIKDVLNVTKKMSYALQHGCNEVIIFTDLKNDNLLVIEENEVCPIDFGDSVHVGVGKKMEYWEPELALKGTLNYATQENIEKISYNVANYPHAVQARKMLALLGILEDLKKNDATIIIPPLFTADYQTKLKETANIPMYKYDHKSVLYAFGCVLEVECIKKIEAISDDYEEFAGLPKRYELINNDPLISILNQLLKITKKLKDASSIYTEADVIADATQLEQRIEKSQRIAEQLKTFASTPTKLSEIASWPESNVIAKALHDPNREVWNNTIQSLVIDLDSNKHDMVLKNDGAHVVDIDKNKTVNILSLIDDPTDINKTQQLVEIKLLDSDEGLESESQILKAKALLRATFYSLEKDENGAVEFTLRDCNDYPEYAIHLTEIANTLRVNEGLNINIKFDANTAAAVAHFKQHGSDAQRHHL